MRNHATYRLVENARGCPEMVGSPGRVCVHSLPQIGEVLQLVPIEGTGLVYLLTSEVGHINCKKWTFKRYVTQIPEILTPPMSRYKDGVVTLCLPPPPPGNNISYKSLPHNYYSLTRQN